MRLAVIPARGGSKRIPRKNIKPFAGKPIIAHVISIAIASRLFDRIVVSTDDEEIASIARRWGAETPFLRPAKLADDHTPTVPVIAHAIRACHALGWVIEEACCLYPAAPFIDITDLKAALKLRQETEAPYSFPVTTFPSPIQRALRRRTDGAMQPFYPEFTMHRSQDLESAYYDAGQFYWGVTKAWFDNDNIHLTGVGLVIPNWRVVDIDTQEDWMRAEVIYRSIHTAGAPE